MHPVRTALLITALALIVAAGCSSSHATGSSSRVTTTTRTPSLTPKQAAVELGQRMLDDAILPEGSHISTVSPPAHLREPMQVAAMGNLEFAHRLWSVPGSQDGVREWLKAHVPDGFVNGGNPTLTGPGFTILGVQEDLARLPANTSDAELQFAIAAIDGRSSLVRVDTIVGWIGPRPADEYVSEKDRVVTVRVVGFGTTGPARKTVVVTDPKVAAPIVDAFNALAVAAPRVVHSCPMIPVGAVGYRIAFAAAPNAEPDVTASIGPCSIAVEVTVDGRKAPALAGPAYGAFRSAVAQALGLPALDFG